MIGVRRIKTELTAAVNLMGMVKDRLVYKQGAEVLLFHPPHPRKQQYLETYQNAEAPLPMKQSLYSLHPSSRKDMGPREQITLFKPQVLLLQEPLKDTFLEFKFLSGICEE